MFVLASACSPIPERTEAPRVLGIATFRTHLPTHRMLLQATFCNANNLLQAIADTSSEYPNGRSFLHRAP